ncbi:MAG: hypothetical protein GF398_11765 [Chitinivibrionales bacterium]|nr:hypothetical protein [Chitinivibrionales bacterium]
MIADQLDVIAKIFLAGYIFSIACLNLVCYLISSFYQDKFHERTPRIVFLVAIFLSILTMVSTFIIEAYPAIIAIKATLAISTSIASVVSSLQLFATMKRVRK